MALVHSGGRWRSGKGGSIYHFGVREDLSAETADFAVTPVTSRSSTPKSDISMPSLCIGP